jgi:hypothetical protein
LMEESPRSGLRGFRSKGFHRHERRIVRAERVAIR